MTMICDANVDAPSLFVLCWNEDEGLCQFIDYLYHKDVEKCDEPHGQLRHPSPERQFEQFLLKRFSDPVPLGSVGQPQPVGPQKTRRHRILRHQNRPKLFQNHLQKRYLLLYAGVTKDSSLSDHGLDSLDAIELAMQVE